MESQGTGGDEGGAGPAITPVIVPVITPVITPVVMMEVLRGKHAPTPGSEIGESYEHWRRMVYVAMGRWPFCLAPARRGFQSVAIPARYAGLLAAYLGKQGYETRVSASYTDEARMLAFWRRLRPSAETSAGTSLESSLEASGS